MLGLPLDTVISMDMISFNSLHASVQRLKTEQRVDTLWSRAMGANAGAGDIKKITKGWLRAVGIGPEDDQEEIIAKFGSVTS